MIRKSLGQERVRTDFNVENDDYISKLKNMSARLIDEIDQAACDPSWSEETLKEWLRLKALAMTSIEEGAMWAVKAATI